MIRSIKSMNGFSLIEVVVFIIVTGLVMSTIMLSATQALRRTPDVHRQWVALETAKLCMEWFINQRRLNGYASLSCPSTPTASACSAPSGYSVSTSISCTTWNGDANYKTITVTVSGNASVALSAQIGSYT